MVQLILVDPTHRNVIYSTIISLPMIDNVKVILLNNAIRKKTIRLGLYGHYRALYILLLTHKGQYAMARENIELLTKRRSFPVLCLYTDLHFPFAYDFLKRSVTMKHNFHCSRLNKPNAQLVGVRNE